MKDAITARLVDARTIALRAAVEMDEGEAKSRVHVALAALSDAIEQRSDDLQDHVLRVLHDLDQAA